jgi:hypothetical protein
MNYLKVLWVHPTNNDPVLLFSELDFDRWEVRKVEVFSDGSFGLANRQVQIGSTVLGEVPIPEISEILLDKEFIPSSISEFEFEDIWSQAVSSTK